MANVRAGAQAPPQLRVCVLNTGVVVPLPERGEVTFGRAGDNDVVIDDPSVSRRHAVLAIAPGGLTLRDLGSANGTRLDTRSAGVATTAVFDAPLPPNRAVEIAPGTLFRLGSALLVVRALSAPAGDDAASGLADAPPLVLDPAMRALYETVTRVAAGTISVLLLGETGVGKERVAEAVHERSARGGYGGGAATTQTSARRAAGPFVRLNCAALAESLLEGELFGHEKGAFTGADQARAGLLESADGGTLFLDEVGELSAATQAKLLRAIEQRQVTRVGGVRPRAVDVRFVSATNRDLAAEVERGAFRRDLYFRLAGVTLEVPPLRARPSEIVPLAERFAAQTSAQLGRVQPPALSPAAVAQLARHRWPGNVRELRNVIERAVLLCQGDTIEPGDLRLDAGATGERGATTATPSPVALATNPPPAPPRGELRDELDAFERDRIVAALEKCAGNQTHAAELLGISRRTLIARLDEYGIPRPRKRGPAV